MRHIKAIVKLVAHGALLILLIACGAVMPATALDFSGHGQNEFCTALDARTKRVDAELSQTQAEVRQSWQQQTDRLRVMSQEQMSSHLDFNSTIDDQRAHNIRELRNRATTNSQRVAIDNYKQTQNQANSVRRSTVREADDSFTAAVRRLVSDRQAAQAGQMEALRIALDDALQTASGECAAGDDPAQVNQEFVASVHASRDTFLTQRKSDDAIAKQMASVAHARQQSVESANQAYRSAMTDARITLQQALGDTN